MPGVLSVLAAVYPIRGCLYTARHLQQIWSLLQPRSFAFTHCMAYILYGIHTGNCDHGLRTSVEGIPRSQCYSVRCAHVELRVRRGGGGGGFIDCQQVRVANGHNRAIGMSDMGAQSRRISTRVQRKCCHAAVVLSHRETAWS